MKNIINEVNLYGFEQGKVDSGKAVLGGDGGNWGGSMERALQIATIIKGCGGPNPSSQKRSRVKTASGNVSDHYQGNTSAYAIDIPANGTNGDKLLSCLMSKFNNGAQAGYKGGKWLDVNVDGYRYQFGWRVKDHYDHIHVGVKKGGGGSTQTIPVDDASVTDTTGTDTTGTDSSYVPPSQKLADKLRAIDLSTVKRLLPQVNESKLNKLFIYPIESKILKNGGKKIVFKGQYGVKILAPFKGVIDNIDNDKIIVRHTFNSKYYYSEIEGVNQIIVSKGQNVNQGDNIALSGIKDITFKIVDEYGRSQLLSKFYLNKEKITEPTDKSDSSSNRAAKAISDLFSSVVASPFELAKRATKIGDDDEKSLNEEINRIKKLL